MYLNKLKLLFVTSLLLIMAACSSNSTAGDSQKENKGTTKQSKQQANKVVFSPNIYFAFDKSIIEPSQAAVLDKQVEKIKKEGIKKITIEGHTDSIGTTAYNIALGERRANATKKYLVQKGVDSNIIKIVSYGKSKPIESNDTSAGRAKNRRTVTLFK
ncbi:Peptidoglycan-associated lipoprotein [Candidatus Hepatincola sp. Pdp]